MMKSQFVCLRLAILPLAVVIAATWFPPMAMAQEAEEATEEAASEEAAEEMASEEATEEQQPIEEIVVTAQRREERLIDVPISISVFNTESIEDQTATDLVSLAPKMPNVVMGGRFAAGITIRGISSMAGGPGFPPGVGVELDGVFVGRDRVFNTVLNDIERVEVLRGPQGTLYGKNTIAGTVNIVTRRPTNELDADVDVLYGNYNFLQARGSVGGPLVKDKVLAKISLLYTGRDGYLDNQTLDRDVNEIKEHGARAMMQFNPSDRLRIELFGDFYAQDDESGVLETLSTFDGNFLPFPPYTSVPPLDGTDRIVYLDVPAFRKRDIWGGSGHVIYDMGGVELTSITAYREYTSDFRDDSDGAPLDMFDVGREENLERFSQELRLSSPGAKAFSWIVGAYFDKEDLESFREIRLGEHFPSPILGLPPLPPGYEELAETNVKLDSESWALFFHGSYDFSEKFRISGGIRYTNEKKDLSYSQLPTKVELGLVALFALPIPLIEDDYEDDAPSGDLSLSYFFSPNHTLYFRYANGFKAGGFQADVISPPPFTPPESLSFDPETVDSFEVGYKGVLADRRLSLGISAFYWDFRDKQEMVNTGISFIVSNAAEASSYGAEVELFATPSAGLDIIASGGWLDAKYDLFPNGGGFGIDFDGNKLAGAPDFTGSLAVQYSTPLSGGTGGLGLFVRGDVDHRGAFHTTAANDPLLEVEAFTSLNARIGLEGRGGMWGVYLWGKNLADDTLLGGGQNLLGAILTRSINIGRTYGIELRGRF